MTRRALIYTRVSEDRAGGRSPEEQEAEARSVCHRNGWAVVEVVTDSVGASRYSKGTRAGWKRVTALVESGAVDALVTWEASRAHRDLAAYVALRDLCVRAGVVWSYSGRTYDLADHGDRFATGLDALLAEREAGEVAGRVQRAMRANAVQGKPHGRRLYGFQRVYDRTTGRLSGQVEEPTEAAVVREVFRSYLAGRGPRTIAADLNSSGSRTASGAAWSDVQIRRMLRTPAYAARRQHRGEVVGPGDWPALVEPEMFDRVQARLDDVRARNPRIRGTAKLLSGVGRCGVCGGKVASIHDRNKRKTYACKTGFHVGRDLKKLDAFVSAIVIERLSRPDAAAAVRGPAVTPASDDARSRAAQIRAQLDDAVSEFTAGNLSGALLAQVEQQLRPALNQAEREAQREYVGLDLDVPVTDVAGWWDALGEEVRREVVGALLTSVTIMPTERGSRRFDPEAVVVDFRGA
ncbi:MAG TPA: recombinase family protein [Aquihabitans sp.]|jgi:DNA invertase Pin-like site-specific DNA recombinase|nr:recombinase family protein [Aquihabitans sp.]